MNIINLINKHMKYRLVSAVEKYIQHSGLRAEATYTMVHPDYKGSALLFPRTIVFWNRHAPVELEADLITTDLNGIYMRIDKDGEIQRTSEGFPLITRNEVLFCPKTKEGSYFAGYSPQEQKAKLMTRLVQCEWG